MFCPMTTLHTAATAEELCGGYPPYYLTQQILNATINPSSMVEYMPEWLSTILLAPKSPVIEERIVLSSFLTGSTISIRQKDPPWQSGVSPIKREYCSGVVAGRSASVSSSLRSSSEGKDGYTSPYHTPSSIFKLNYAFSNGRPSEVGQADTMRKMSKISDDPPERGSKIFWKYRKRQKIVPHSKRAAVPNVIEEMYDSPLMDAIEWTTAESRRPKITEDPQITSLSNIQAELKDQMLLIHQQPEKYGNIVVRYKDIFKEVSLTSATEMVP